jgi:CubicO group peptidase (beta-lactamase class C family)
LSPDELSALLATNLDDITADGIAIGATTGAATGFAGRGAVAGRTVGPDTVFYGASLTKQIVGFLLARAVRAGAVSAADRLRRWLPELPDWTAEVRLEHLLHHTSDLPEVTHPWLAAGEGNAVVIDRLRGLDPPPQIAPGTRFAYSNTGYVLLAEVVGRIAGRDIGTLAAGTLFAPLGLTATRLGGEQIPVADDLKVPGTVGDGGIWTSVTDQLRWLTALNDGTLDPGAVHLLETTGRLEDGSSLDYGWGVGITETPAGRRISHGGTWDPWLAKSVRVPERGVAVAVLSIGSTESVISDTGFRIADLLASRD